MAHVTRPAPQSQRPSSRARGSAKVAAGIFLSRIAGLVRESVFAAYFATSGIADAWRAALKVPNLLQNLLGEGTLSASFIPIYSELQGEGREEEARRFAGAVLGLLIAVVAVVVAIGILIAPFVISVLLSEWSEEQQALTVTLVRILFPMTGTLVLSAWALGILNSHRRLFLPYVAPLAWNAALIGALLLGGSILGRRDEALIRFLAWGGVLGGALQFGVQLPLVLSLNGGLRLSFFKRVHGVRDAIRAFFPTLAARGAVNLSGYIDVVLVGFLASGAMSALGYAQTLYLLPISLFGLSVAASELPELARDGRMEGSRLRGSVGRAKVRVLYFLLPSSVALIVLGDLIVGALYGWGEFGEADIVLTWAILASYAIGIPASGVSRLYSSAFYALRNTRTPAIAAYVRLALSALVGFLLMRPLDEVAIGPLRMGAVGLALAASAAAWAEFFFLTWRLKRAGATDGDRSEERSLLAVSSSAVLAGGAGVGASFYVDSLHIWLQLGLVLLAFGGVYLGMTRVLNAADPLEELLARRRG